MTIPMKRDMDFLRDLLLEIEAGRREFDTIRKDIAEVLGIDTADALPAADAEKIGYHLRLLEDAGFVVFSFKSLSGTWAVERITIDVIDRLADALSVEIEVLLRRPGGRN